MVGEISYHIVVSEDSEAQSPSTVGL